MRGYSIISDEERQSIIKQHESVYDGYAVGNVNTNMYPLTVGDYATDKGGITVNNKGEISTYKNHLVNESNDKDVNRFSPMTYVKKILDGKMTIEDVVKETGIPFTVLSKIAKKISGKALEVNEYASADTNYDEVDPAYDFKSGGPEEFEPDYETDPMDSDIQAIQNMFDFQSQHDSDPDATEMVKNSENAMNQEFSGKEKYADETNAYDFESDGPTDAYESVIEESMCNECGMSESLCECWMNEEIDEEIKESFKEQKEKITEMFNRFKKYN